MDMDIDIDTDIYRDSIDIDTDIGRSDLIYLERTVNSTWADCLNVDMNTHGPHKYLCDMETASHI